MIALRSSLGRQIQVTSFFKSQLKCFSILLNKKSVNTPKFFKVPPQESISRRSFTQMNSESSKSNSMKDSQDYMPKFMNEQDNGPQIRQSQLQQLIRKLQIKIQNTEEINLKMQETLDQKQKRLNLVKNQIKEIESQRLKDAHRYKKNKQDAQLYAITKIAKEIVEVRDNLERAIQMSNSFKQSKNDKEAETVFMKQQYSSLYQGLKITANTLDISLKRCNITEFFPQNGQAFDKKYHSVDHQINGTGKKIGTIGRVVRSGWRFGNKILKTATVGLILIPLFFITISHAFYVLFQVGVVKNNTINSQQCSSSDQDQDKQ